MDLFVYAAGRDFGLAAIVYLILINIAAFGIYGMDKARAVRGAFRISEKKLLLLAAAGGAFGAFLGMRIFRHKTRHLKFAIGVPAMAVIWSAFLIWFWQRI